MLIVTASIYMFGNLLVIQIFVMQGAELQRNVKRGNSIEY